MRPTMNLAFSFKGFIYTVILFCINKFDWLKGLGELAATIIDRMFTKVLLKSLLKMDGTTYIVHSI